MSLEQLWAGWRAGYVASVSDGEPDVIPEGTVAKGETTEPGPGGECVFCRIVTSEEPDEVRHVVWSGPLTVALLNAYPYASGHMLVMPRRHVGGLEELTPEEASELWSAIRDAVVAIKATYAPDGLNIGANLGRAAGAGIPSHLHLHVLPRWIGDTNFMTTVASVRVMPEALSDSWVRLRAAWPKSAEA